MFHVHIKSRDYTEWYHEPIDDDQEFDLSDLNPATNKLFHGDQFVVEDPKTNQPKPLLRFSPVRSQEHIPAVLHLHDDRTYGKSASGKPLYKCVPDDVRLPAFLVPYQIKTLGFSKYIFNLYVTITFVDWTGKHPLGHLNQVLGSVDQLDAFYEYQLYCKGLHHSIQPFMKAVNKTLKGTKSGTNYDLTDRTADLFFTIDSRETTDYDDALCIHTIDDTTIRVSVAIANVPLYIESLGLWSAFSERVSTIYLPDKKRPMLPTTLSEGLCSLQQGAERIAFVMDVIIKSQEVYSVTFSSARIRVKKNYAYEEPALHRYQDLFQVTKTLSDDSMAINDSHDLVAFWMVFMNREAARELTKKQTGIFRTQPATPYQKIDDDDIRSFVERWNQQSEHTAAKYVLYDAHHNETYTHITSPIRRMVDLLNMIELQRTTIPFSHEAIAFLDAWTPRLDLVNDAMRKTRRLQHDAELLHRCTHEPTLLQETHTGYLIEKNKIPDNSDLFEYIIYLPNLQLVTRMKSTNGDLPLYEKALYQLFLFENEERFKKKIRVQMVTTLC